MAEAKRVDYKGKTVVFQGQHLQMVPGTKLKVEGYWNDVTGKTWMEAYMNGNPGAVIYAVRVITQGLPPDNEVLYTHSVKSGLGHLVHISEITEE